MPPFDNEPPYSNDSDPSQSGPRYSSYGGSQGDKGKRGGGGANPRNRDGTSTSPQSLIKMPQAVESEQIILGTLLLDPVRIVDAIEELGADGAPFYGTLHREIYKCILAVNDETGAVVEPSSVRAAMEKRPLLARLDLDEQLAQLEMAVIAPASLPTHIAIVLEKWRLRRLIETCADTLEAAQTEEKEVKDLLDDAERRVFELAQERQNQGSHLIHELTVTTLQNIEERVAAGKPISGVSTRFEALDYKTGGLQRSDLIILGARPSMGKTAFALNIALNVATHPNREERKAVGIFSMEMSGEQLTQRLLAQLSKVDLKSLRSGKLRNDQMDLLAEHGALLGDAPVFIDDSFGLSILELRSKARRMVAQVPRPEDFGLIVIDYLQLMRGGGSRQENRQQEITEISRSLKALARELHVPVLALSQLSRSSEQRKGTEKRPVLSDLRESGAIEQDADVVMFIHREDYYRRRMGEGGKEDQVATGFGANKGGGGFGAGGGQDNVPALEIAEILIRKQRNGPTGTVELYFEPDLTRFLNKDWQHDGGE